MSISHYIYFVQCLTRPLRRRQQAPPKCRQLSPTPNTMSYPTRRLLSTLRRKNEYRIRLHNRPGDVENIMSVYIPDFSILRSPYTKVRQVPGAYYFPYYFFFRLFLAFLKISSQKHTQNCPSAAHGEHIHLCLAAISNHRGTFRLQWHRWCQVKNRTVQINPHTRTAP